MNPSLNNSSAINPPSAATPATVPIPMPAFAPGDSTLPELVEFAQDVHAAVLAALIVAK
jgi:hypothetical protein